MFERPRHGERAVLVRLGLGEPLRPEDLEEFQQRLGHTSVKTTEMYLAYLTADEKQIAMFGTARTGTKSGTRTAVENG